MAEAPSRFGGNRPYVEPGYLGVGWSTEIERPLKGGRRCPRCGRVGGEPGPYPVGRFCLACLGMHPDDEREARRDGTRSGTNRSRSSDGPAHRDRPKRLSAAEERVIGANLHGRIWLEAVRAERSGRPDVATTYRLWLAMYRDGELTEEDLRERAVAAGFLEAGR